MEIYAKASLCIEEIKEKMRCGCDAVEYNLEYDFFQKGECFEKNYPPQVFTMKNVGAVHVPYDHNGQMMNLERVFQKEDLSPVRNVFRLAQYCARIWEHKVLVVIHASISYYEFMEYELLRKRIGKELGCLLQEFPMVDLAIENVVPMEYKEALSYSPRLCNGIFTDLTQIVQYLRESFGDRVGSVLDICHAAMTQKYMNALLSAADFLPQGAPPDKIDYSMEHFFKANLGLCRLIHFNDFTGNGFAHNHGTGFRSQDKVDALLKLYKDYGYDCPLTLEIREDDYCDCINYRRAKSMVEAAGADQ